MKKTTMMYTAPTRILAVVAVAFAAQTAFCQQKFETQLNIAYADTDNPRQQLDLYLPTKRGEKVARQTSPLSHVSKDDVPFLIIHGTEGKVVPFDQSVTFHAALKASGVDSTLLEMSGGGHGDPYHRGEFDQQMRAFFDKHLRDVQPALDELPRTSSSSVPARVGASSEAGAPD